MGARRVLGLRDPTGPRRRLWIPAADRAGEAQDPGREPAQTLRHGRGRDAPEAKRDHVAEGVSGSAGIRSLLDDVPHLPRLSLDELSLVAVRVLDKGDLVIVPVGGERLGLERDLYALLFEAGYGTFHVVYREGDVGVAVALVVGFGPVVVVGKLQHGRRSILLHCEEVIGGRAEVHLAKL